MPSTPSRLTRVVAAAAVVSLLITACVPISRWSFTAPGGPVPPFGSASLRGEPGRSTPVALAPTPAPAATATPTPTPAVATEPMTLAQAQECLDAGSVVYGIALQNANVRQGTGTNACRVGRIPKGSLVRVTASVGASSGLSAAEIVASGAAIPRPQVGVASAAGHSQATSQTEVPAPAEAPAASAAPAQPSVGYIEDIQPIFLRTCNSCHSGIVKNKELQVTTYEALMRGSTSGPVVLPGDPANSILWQMVSTGKMPLVGTLSDSDRSLVERWIAQGAPERRPAPAATPQPAIASSPVAPVTEAGARLWLEIAAEDFDPVAESCDSPAAQPLSVVSSELILPVACGSAPDSAGLDLLRASLALPGGSAAAPDAPAAAAPASAVVTATEGLAAVPAAPISQTAAITAPAAVVPLPAAGPAFAPATAAATGITAGAWGLPAPSDDDGWLTPRGGLCIDRRLPDNSRGITALAFAPDGRLFIAFDSNLAGESDPLILYDAYHPSRSVAVMDLAAGQDPVEILVESTRVTGMDWENGALYLSRAGEVGSIPDGGTYELLAGGFAVTSQLFHANNGLVISGGWLYVSAGGVIDGYSDGPIVGMDEASAQQIASGGNPYAARIVRAPLESLLGQRSIAAFSTAARGVRNPYGITVDPAGQIWFTDNGATNLPDDVSAGDEVNVLSPAAIGGDEASSPYYGFPLALTASADWYTRPAVVLPNTAAPTGITWALGTIYFAQYGKDPGLYRIGAAADGTLRAERVMLGWPILALATAPDGALWIGMGDGGLFRLTSGC